LLCSFSCEAQITPLPKVVNKTKVLNVTSRRLKQDSSVFDDDSSKVLFANATKGSILADTLQSYGYSDRFFAKIIIPKLKLYTKYNYTCKTDDDDNVARNNFKG